MQAAPLKNGVSNGQILAPESLDFL